MARFDHDSRILHAKIVYYGPPLSGKTTNLVSLHRILDPEGRSRLFSLNTSEDRTLFFDMMPLEVGRILNHTLRLQVYTIPGQVHYRSTRRMILKGADACVFVADSRPGTLGANLSALEDLCDNLAVEGQTLETLPLVFQYNKRDVADAIPSDELEKALNIVKAPFLGSVAKTGDGVVETIRFATEGLVRSLIEKYGGGDQTPGEEASDLVASVFHKFLDRDEPVLRRGVPEWVRNYPRPGSSASPESTDEIPVYGDIHAAPKRDVEPPGDDQVQVLEPEELLEESLRTQMQLAEEYNELRREREELEEKAKRRDQETRQAMEHLLEADEAHENLLSALSQDLEGPLSSLAEKVDSIARDPDSHVARETLAEAKEEGKKIQALVREILSARRESSGGLSPEELIERARCACTDAARSKGVTIELQLEEDLPALAGDEARLGFAVRAVVEHAIQVSPEAKPIRIKASYKEMEVPGSNGGGSDGRRFVAIQVRDFSPGHSREAWERLFLKAGDDSMSEMARCREVLRRMDGVMQVKSRAGKGNLVTLYIPVAETTQAPMTADRTA